MSSAGSLLPRVNGRTLLVASVLAVAGGAWLGLWLLGQPFHSSLHGHGQHHHHSAASANLQAPAMLLFVFGWTMMTMAMMLPTTLPLLMVFRKITSEKVDKAILVTLLAGGYVFAWTVFGLLVYLAKAGLERLAALSPWLNEHSWAVSACLVLAAGVFQFTPLKYRCLEKCRSPLSFVISHWRGERERWQSFRLGLDHGIYCIGCCWALMLLMFAVGAGSLLWMIVLAVVMGIEKNVSWGKKLSAPLGILLVASGLVLLVRGPG